MTTASVTAERRTSEASFGVVLRKVRNSYVLRRILRALFVIYLVATGVFFMVRLLPGNPVDVYINSQIAMYGKSYETAAAEAAALFSFDPGTPMWRQYVDYLVGIVRGDLGMSILSPGTSVVQKIALHLPWTLFSVGLAMIISVSIGLLLGMVMAYRRGGIIDHGVSTLGSVLHAIPNYLFAIMVVVIGAVQLHLIDFTRMRGHSTPGVTPEFSFRYLSDALYHATLPMVVYIFTTVGTWALVMKSSTTQILGEDYVTVARARGLGDGRIRSMYVGRNAVLPLVAQIATQAGFVVGGAIFVEQTFSYDGIGITLFQSINARDYPVIQGILLVITITVVLANLIADLVYSVLDPRIRTGERED
ncbi:ABC transporter permease [Microlunatus panaciterrae]|uniref:Peptide/nickel transport system permease protein n=1 Tax=Microlunatus panaciterrae TaxID=400768 RepID=A0ABS2RM69_9ACTN|nr:ABC transporter permease [Microlunatus panaciterrae]MBM7799692.1 peptide/nickel transport system permease protein [Microlunatus panaciterrae]